MATRSPIRRLILITGTLLSLLIVAAFVLSAWWMVMVQLGPVEVYVMAGTVRAFVDDRLLDPFAVDGHDWDLQAWNSWRSGTRWIEFPIYAIFLTVAVPTLLVWRFWPRPIKPGHCRCGYDLTGNTSGVCPECGQGTE